MAKFQPKGGNLLEIRGLAGTSIDDAIHDGILEGVAAHPEFKIVASVDRRLGPDDGAEGGRDRPAVAARRSSASSTRAATAMARRRPSPPPASRARPSSWATARTSCSGGRSRRTRTATRPGRPRSRRASRRSPSGSRSRSSTATRTSRTICWCPISPSPRTISRAALPNIQKGGVASHEYTQADAIAAIKANMK